MSADFKWYVVRAISGKEKKAKEAIHHEITFMKAEELVEEILIPTEKFLQLKDGKKKLTERSSYPGYILIKAALNGDLIQAIKNLPNVVGFLSDRVTDRPIPMRQDEVDKMLQRFKDVAGMTETLLVPFVVGETVKVTDGPFNGFTGIIEEVQEDKKKLKVMVKIFGRKTPLELGYPQVDKL